MYDVIRRTAAAGGRHHHYFTREQDARSRGQLVRDVLKYFEPGDTIEFGRGYFEFEERGVDLRGLQIRGPGKEQCLLFNTLISDQAGAAFLVGGPKVEVRDVAFESRSTVDHQDDQCLALVPAEIKEARAEDMNWHVQFFRTRVKAQSWGFYNWRNNRCMVEFHEGCELYSGRLAVSGQGSGVDGAQNFRFIDALLDVDTQRSISHGAVSHETYGAAAGAVLRSGTHQFVRTTFRIRNQARTRANLAPPRTVGITDWFEKGSRASTKILVEDCLFDLEPNGAALPPLPLDVERAEVQAAVELRGRNVVTSPFPGVTS